MGALMVIFSLQPKQKAKSKGRLQPLPSNFLRVFFFFFAILRFSSTSRRKLAPSVSEFGAFFRQRWGGNSVCAPPSSGLASNRGRLSGSVVFSPGRRERAG